MKGLVAKGAVVVNEFWKNNLATSVIFKPKQTGPLALLPPEGQKVFAIRSNAARRITPFHINKHGVVTFNAMAGGTYTLYFAPSRGIATGHSRPDRKRRTNVKS